MLDQAGRHERRPAVLAAPRSGPGDRDRLAVLRGVAEDDRVGPLLGQQAGERPAVVGAIVTVSKPFLITFDGSRIDSTRSTSGDVLPQRGQVGPEGRRSIGLLTDVALRAGQRRLIEHHRPAAGIAQPAGVRGQRGGSFCAEDGIEARSEPHPKPAP